MLYLIRDRDYIKIGFTDNLDQRQKAYETTNCYAEVIMTKDGSRRDEKILHELCKQWHYKNEWFNYDDEIVRIFKEYKPDIEEEVKNLKKKIKELEDSLKNINCRLNALSIFTKEHMAILEMNQTRIEDLLEKLFGELIKLN